MKKPQDPRFHGLKEPEKVYVNKQMVPLSPLKDKDAIIDFDNISALWIKICKDFQDTGSKISKGPLLDLAYGYDAKLIYYVSTPNLNYELEKKQFDTAVSLYEEQLKKYEEYTEKLKSNELNDLDIKIERAKKRLANLEALKEGKAIPFPE